MQKPNQIMLWINQTKPFSTSILVCPYDGVSRRSIDNWFVAVGSATWLKRASTGNKVKYKSGLQAKLD